MPLMPPNHQPEESHRPEPTAAVRSRPHPGEVWLARAMPGEQVARVVAVLDADDRAEAIHAALVSTDVDLATDKDLVLPPAHSGIGFPIVVQCDVVGPLWMNQLVVRIGSLAREQREAAVLAAQIGTVGNTGYAQLPGHFRGPPVRNAFDWRLRHKRFEVNAMLALSRTYVGVILNPVATTWERVAIAATEAIAAVSAKVRLQVAPPTLAHVWAYADELVASESVRSDRIEVADLGFVIEAVRQGDKLLVLIEAPAAQREAIARSRFEVVHGERSEPFQFDADGKVWLSIPMSHAAFVRVREPQP
jgi:hypothetical protein